GFANPLVGGVSAALAAAVFAIVSELLTLGLSRLGGPEPSHVDLVVSVALAPLALAAWAVQARAGGTALTAVGGRVVPPLAVVRSATNVGTHHRELRQLYDLVERERTKLATLLASSGEGIFLVGADGTITEVNDELRRLSGRADEAVGQRIEGAFPFELTT